MSSIAPALRRSVWGYAAVVALLTLTLGLYLWARSGDGHPVPGGREATAPLAAPGVEQADWDLRAYPAGGKGIVTKAKAAAIEAQRGDLFRIVRDTYQALFLAPGSLDKVLEGRFTADAARAFRASGAGLPRGTDDVQIIKREADVGIEVAGVKHAAARVVVIAHGTADGKEWRIFHSSTLWFQREIGKGWSVIGFDVTQRPLDKGKS